MSAVYVQFPPFTGRLGGLLTSDPALLFAQLSLHPPRTVTVRSGPSRSAVGRPPLEPAPLPPRDGVAAPRPLLFPSLRFLRDLRADGGASDLRPRFRKPTRREKTIRPFSTLGGVRRVRTAGALVRRTRRICQREREKVMDRRRKRVGQSERWREGPQNASLEALSFPRAL